MRFEVGKFYRHSAGGFLAVLCKIETTMWGKCLLAETAGPGVSRLIPIGEDEDSAQNYTECSRGEWMSNFC